jgi:hypothetical protein
MFFSKKKTSEKKTLAKEMIADMKRLLSLKSKSQTGQLADEEMTELIALSEKYIK